MAGVSQGRRRAVTIRVDPALLEWVEENAGIGGRYSSISHAVERALVLLRDREG